MRRARLAIVIVFLYSLVPCCWGLKLENEAANNRISLSKLSPPTYPPLARQAHISGEVRLEVRIHPDGSVESVSAQSGPAMLIPTSVESAKHSRFECARCSEANNSYVLTYIFKLIPVTPCSGNIEPQTVDQSEDHITVTAGTSDLCPPLLADTRFRSAKCLYLWKCGRRRFE
jgi:TonB family protein